ncbi:DUF1800 domain-containing protein [Oxalobacteraceae bacterium]|nr:DUF1800 domain-containing protein [Oxalobacteraceae bacterium]
MQFRTPKLLLAALAICVVSACGDRSHDANSSEARSGQGGLTLAETSTSRMSQAEAARFLTQASFGPSMASINALVEMGPDNWITDQFSKMKYNHLDYMKARALQLDPGVRLDQPQFFESFWRQAIGGEDQLRQRMSFALSEIFVVSYDNAAGENFPRGIGDYYDRLGRYCFGNFRELLEHVALHPMMGIYLSHLRNQKEQDYRLPDENFAREIMQLFTIGLYQLNPDGSVKLSNGKPIETYTHDDVAGLAKVFTGWSWRGPDRSIQRFYGYVAAEDRDWKLMQNYPDFHSTSEKKFLGVTIRGNTSGEWDAQVALDTLFNHPNVGPFIGRQLIQRLVTSNPSPAYIGRVSAAFADNGSGVRGDMKAVIRAILLDPEARQPGNPTVSKLREPIVRLANWARAFNAKSGSGRFYITTLDDPLTGLGQSPMRSPSVFNFYRPSYVPPNSSIADAGQVAPEMQITAEPSVTGYLNFMEEVVRKGVGSNYDVRPDYAAEIALADTPELLLDRVSLLLTNGTMSPELRGMISTAMTGMYYPKPDAGNAAVMAEVRRQRACLAIFLTMASPEYLVQK